MSTLIGGVLAVLAIIVALVIYKAVQDGKKLTNKLTALHANLVLLYTLARMEANTLENASDEAVADFANKDYDKYKEVIGNTEPYTEVIVKFDKFIKRLSIPQKLAVKFDPKAKKAYEKVICLFEQLSHEVLKIERTRDPFHERVLQKKNELNTEGKED